MRPAITGNIDPFRPTLLGKAGAFSDLWGMAKQVGEIKIVGTFDDITFYKMDGEYYARKKSRLRGERVKRAKEFTRTMASAHRLGRGSQLASQMYRRLPKAEQVYGLFKELKRLAVLALKEGVSEAAVLLLLEQRVGKEREPVVRVVERPKKKVAVKAVPGFNKQLFHSLGERKRGVKIEYKDYEQLLMVLRE
jgi:hypothetical protein